MTRRVALPLLLALMLPLLTLAAAVWADNDANRGVTFAPADRPIPFADAPRLGVNAYNLQFEPDPAAVTRTLELAHDLGARTVRIQMPWEDVEIHAKGDFQDRRQPGNVRDAWEKYDVIADESRRLGLELIVRIDRPPRWARAATADDPQFLAGLAENANSTAPPDRFEDFADFAGAVAAHFKGRIRFYQIWNEPNLSYEWGWRPPDPERFVALLGVASAAIRAADPQATILFPSLSPTDGKEPRIAPMSELEYLDRAYRAGAAPHFDIMSAQGYGLGQPPDEHRYVRLRWSPRRPLTDLDRPIDTRIDVSRVVLLHEVMLRHGDDKAVWISEFGYNSAPEGIPNRDAWGPPVSEAQKGEYLIGQIERARREWPWLGVMNLWMLRWGGYQQPDPNDPTQYFAVVGRNYAPLPSYDALRQFMVGGEVAGVGSHTGDHPALVADGAGRYTLRFAGEALRLRAGTIVAIDGAQRAPGSSVAGLPLATHSATILADAPPEFVVSRAAPSALAWDVALLLPLLWLVCGCGWLAARR